MLPTLDSTSRVVTAVPSGTLRGSVPEGNPPTRLRDPNLHFDRYSRNREFTISPASGFAKDLRGFPNPSQATKYMPFT